MVALGQQCCRPAGSPFRNFETGVRVIAPPTVHLRDARRRLLDRLLQAEEPPVPICAGLELNEFRLAKTPKSPLDRRPYRPVPSSVISMSKRRKASPTSATWPAATWLCLSTSLTSSSNASMPRYIAPDASSSDSSSASSVAAAGCREASRSRRASLLQSSMSTAMPFKRLRDSLHPSSSPMRTRGEGLV